MTAGPGTTVHANVAADAAPVGAGSVSWQVHREMAILLGWGRAILLQLAHPLVARGVADHSTFRAGRFARWRRLHRTLEAMLAMTFGPVADTERAIAGINAIHDRVHGALPAGAGPFPSGAPYSAHDPDLLTWVHATCVESFLLAYETFVAPLTPRERDRYCDEASWIEPKLGIPSGALPRTIADLEAYMRRTYASGDIVVTDTARALARDVIDPPLPWPIRPLTTLIRLPTIGLLPPPIREAYGLAWGPARERCLRASARTLRAVVPRLPGMIRQWPRARQALRARPAHAVAPQS